MKMTDGDIWRPMHENKKPGATALQQTELFEGIETGMQQRGHTDRKDDPITPTSRTRTRTCMREAQIEN